MINACGEHLIIVTISKHPHTHHTLPICAAFKVYTVITVLVIADYKRYHLVVRGSRSQSRNSLHNRIGARNDSAPTSGLFPARIQSTVLLTRGGSSNWFEFLATQFEIESAQFELEFELGSECGFELGKLNLCFSKLKLSSRNLIWVFGALGQLNLSFGNSNWIGGNSIGVPATRFDFELESDTSRIWIGFEFEFKFDVHWFGVDFEVDWQIYNPGDS